MSSSSDIDEAALADIDEVAMKAASLHITDGSTTSSAGGGSGNAASFPTVKGTGAQDPLTGDPLVLAASFASLIMGDTPTAENQLRGVVGLRKLLSIERNPPIQQVVDTGVVPYLIPMLIPESGASANLTFEATWALTNIASGDSHFVTHLAGLGIIPLLINLLRHTSVDCVEQAVWALGNIAGDSPQYRDLVLRSGCMDAVLVLVTSSQKITLLRNLAWTISNLCRGKPAPDFSATRACLPQLATLLYSTDDEVKTDVCWAFSYLTDGADDRIQAVIEVGCVRRLVELLASTNPNILTPALRTVGNIVTGDDLQTQVVLNCGVLAMMPALLRHAKVGIRKEACWALSNLTAGNPEQIQAVIDARLVPQLLELLRSGPPDVRKEATWAISNMTSGARPAQIEAIVKLNAIESLATSLDSSDQRVQMVTLEGIQNMMRIGRSLGQKSLPTDEMAAFLAAGTPPPVENPYAVRLQGCPEMETLRKLVVDAVGEVQITARNILEEFLPEVLAELETTSSTKGAGGGGGGKLTAGRKPRGAGAAALLGASSTSSSSSTAAFAFTTTGTAPAFSFGGPSTTTATGGYSFAFPSTTTATTATTTTSSTTGGNVHKSSAPPGGMAMSDDDEEEEVEGGDGEGDEELSSED